MKIRIEYKKIFILFILGIGFPCLLLAYLAYRGIKNDQALMEKEQRIEHRRIVQLITNHIQEKFAETRSNFLQTVKTSYNESNIPFIRTSKTFKQQHAIIEEIFVIDKTDNIQIPSGEFLFRQENGGSYLPSQNPTLNNVMQEAQRCEFQLEDFQRAIRLYTQTLQQTPHPQLKCQSLHSIARIQKKLNRHYDAILTYQQLIQEFHDTPLLSGIPAGLIAQYELSLLYIISKDTIMAVRELTDLYKKLLVSTWPLQKSQYEFYVAKINQTFENIAAESNFSQADGYYHSLIDSLKSEEEKLIHITNRLLLFLEKAPAQLFERNLITDNPLSAGKNFSLEIDGQLYLVSIMDLPFREEIYDAQILGFLFNPDYLRLSLLPSAIEQYFSSREIHWQITDRYGNVLLHEGEIPSGAATIQASFADNQPPWTLEVFQQDLSLFGTLLFSRRSIYFFTFILIALILAFGLYFTIRMLTHELEFATMKSNFVSAISHDLKSPLTSIRQLAEMLQAGRVPSEKRRQRYHDVLVEQSERLSFLVDNILDSARMEEGKVNYFFEKVDVKELLKEIISKIENQVQHDGFTINSQIADHIPEIVIDRAAMNQAITNLIDNAVKFSDKSKVIEVKLLRENKHITIAVTDYGIGIKKTHLKNIFERFFRGTDEKIRRTKGSGLGLTLVKQIVEAHHGSIQVESEPNLGSTFTIKLPEDLRE